MIPASAVRDSASAREASRRSRFHGGRPSDTGISPGRSPRALPEKFGHLTPQECVELPGEAARVLAYARALRFISRSEKSLVTRVSEDLGLAKRTVQGALTLAEQKGLIRLRRGRGGAFIAVEVVPRGPVEDEPENRATSHHPTHAAPTATDVPVAPTLHATHLGAQTANQDARGCAPTCAPSAEREEETLEKEEEPAPASHGLQSLVPEVLVAFGGPSKCVAQALRELEHVGADPAFIRLHLPPPGTTWSGGLWPWKRNVEQALRGPNEAPSERTQAEASASRWARRAQDLEREATSLSKSGRTAQAELARQRARGAWAQADAAAQQAGIAPATLRASLPPPPATGA